eukprot:545559-Alexandrium_andersonii.AAC.1
MSRPCFASRSNGLAVRKRALLRLLNRPVGQVGLHFPKPRRHLLVIGDSMLTLRGLIKDHHVLSLSRLVAAPALQAAVDFALGNNPLSLGGGVASKVPIWR